MALKLKQTYVHWILGRGPTLGESNESHLESSNVKYKMKSCNKMDALSWAGRAHASRHIMSQTILLYTFSNLPLQKVSKRQVTSVLKHYRIFDRILNVNAVILKCSGHRPRDDVVENSSLSR